MGRARGEVKRQLALEFVGVLGKGADLFGVGGVDGGGVAGLKVEAVGVLLAEEDGADLGVPRHRARSGPST